MSDMTTTTLSSAPSLPAPCAWWLLWVLLAILCALRIGFGLAIDTMPAPTGGTGGNGRVRLMALRHGHGRGSGVPRIEVLPPDELPAGVPESARASGPESRGAGGLFAENNKFASEGGKARKGKTRLATRLRLGETFADPRFDPYARAAKAFQRAQVTTLARTVGGGACGPAPSSMVASAALQLAASRFAFEVEGDALKGSRLANDSRQNLLAAHELCAREAQARPRQDPVALLQRRLQGQDGDQ
jgi:hypothetical protein